MTLVRTLLRNDMSYGEFDQVARKTLADAAYRIFSPTGNRQTVSNVAILARLNRKEVKKLSKLDLAQSGRATGNIIGLCGFGLKMKLSFTWIVSF